MTTMNHQRLNLVMPLVQPRSLQNCRMYLRVSASQILCWLVLIYLFSSRPYHPTRAWHTCCNRSDVQDFGFELFDYCVQLERPVSRWHQVWGLPGHSNRNAHVGLLFVYFTS